MVSGAHNLFHNHTYQIERKKENNFLYENENAKRIKKLKEDSEHKTGYPWVTDAHGDYTYINFGARVEWKR